MYEVDADEDGVTRPMAYEVVEDGVPYATAAEAEDMDATDVVEPAYAPGV